MSQYIEKTKKWIENMVIGLNLCPFAKKPFITHKVRYVVVEGTLEDLVEVFIKELKMLVVTKPTRIETSLIIHPFLLTDFYDYNDFLALLQQVLEKERLEGIIQLASFHPEYQFAGTTKDAAENYTNRSPYPMLHLLREASLEDILSHYPNPELIPEQNIETLNKLGLDGIFDILNK